MAPVPYLITALRHPLSVFQDMVYAHTIYLPLSVALQQVMRRLETPRAVCDCMAALVHGDLANPPSAEEEAVEEAADKEGKDDAGEEDKKGDSSKGEGEGEKLVSVP